MENNTTEGKIKKLLNDNKIVVETRYSTDESKRVAYRSYYVWIIEDGELDSTHVGSDTLYGDEARNILGRYGYNTDSDSVYNWSHSELAAYKDSQAYDKAGWFFVEEPKEESRPGKYSGTYFLG